MKATRYLLLAALVLTANAVRAGDAEIVLELREQATVVRDRVVLEDVARIRTGDAARRVAAAQVELGRVSIDAARTYSRTALAAVLQREFGKMTIRWDGAERVTVTRASRMLDAAALSAAAKAYVEKTVRERDPAVVRVDVLSIDTPDAVRLPVGEVSIVPHSLNGSLRAKRACVWMDVAVDGEARKRIPVWMTVDVFKTVFVSLRPLGARETLQAADVRREVRSVTGNIGETLSAVHGVESFRTRRTLPVGHVLMVGDVEPRPAIARDEPVRVSVRAGAVAIEAQAVAEEDGRVGEWIRLRNPSSNEVFQAKVVSAGHVSVPGEMNQ